MSSDMQQAKSADAIKDQKVIAWIESNIGGTVIRCEQQPRWRGGWWVDVRRDAELLKLYVREERKEDYPPWPLEHEANVLRVLEKHGVPVPHVYGIIGEPHATVMECIPGEFDFAKVSESERVAILRDFADVVARMHAIDPRELVQFGVKMPESPAEISLACFDICEAMYLKGKKIPEPRIEFLRKWVRRNIPTHRKKVSIVAVDSGQFLFENGVVTGLYDFEYGCLGDPMIDLAFIPLRLSMYHVGDTKPFFERYAELTGEQFELPVLAFHAVWWGLCTPFILTADLHAPTANAKYFEYLGWYIGACISMLEVLGDMKGLQLDQHSQVGAAQPSRWAQLFDVMAARVPEPAASEPYAVQEQRKVWEFVKRSDAHRDIEAQYLRDVEKLVGHRVHSWHEADAVLEKFVIEAGPEHDDALIALFHRWAIVQARTFLEGQAHLPMFEASWPRFSKLIA